MLRKCDFWVKLCEPFELHNLFKFATITSKLLLRIQKKSPCMIDYIGSTLSKFLPSEGGRIDPSENHHSSKPSKKAILIKSFALFQYAILVYGNYRKSE